MTLATLELSGVHATSQEAVRRRLLGPWAMGLTQYLAVRLGDMQLARSAFAELRRQVQKESTATFLVAPGPKAHVYRMARRIALDFSERKLERAPEPLQFRAARGSRGYMHLLGEVRGVLSIDESEVLELRYARELSPTEIACVLSLDESHVEENLRTGLERLAKLAPTALVTTQGWERALVVDGFALASEIEVEEDLDSDTHTGLQVGTRIGGRYTVAQRVGVGAYGDVYKADDDDVPGHRVALKILREPALSEAAKAASLRELKLIAAVFHPSVVNFKDHGWHEGRLWFVMPWYEGETLEARMRRLPLTRSEARAIFEPLARALATLHANGIRHQDIKPDNVLLARIKGFGFETGADESILPVLLDLGVAAEEHEALVGGTPLYFAPEVASHYANMGNARPIGPKADVFGLALSLRNALEPSSEEDVAAGAIEAFIEQRARVVPRMPEGADLRFLVPHLSRWLSPDPNARPTAEEFAKELSVLTRPEEERQRRRNILRWLIPISIGLCAAFLAVIYVFQREAEIQADEAREARMEAADVRADLVIEETRRQSLDQDHAALVSRYEQQELTRDELAQRLATSEGQIEILGSEFADVMTERDQTRSLLDATRQTLEAREAERANLARTLDENIRRLRDTESQANANAAALESYRRTHESREQELSDAIASQRDRNENLTRDVADIREQMTQATARAERAESELEQLRSSLRRMATHEAEQAPAETTPE